MVNENQNESSLKSREEALNSVDGQEKVAGDAPNYWIWNHLNNKNLEL